MRLLSLPFLMACLLMSAPTIAQDTGNPTYDMLFKTGTLDVVPTDHRLVYVKDVSNKGVPEAAKRDSGHVELAFDKADPQIALLKFTQDKKYRMIGTFPASVGNPLIMYFLETVVRDMSQTVGGSPFYLRNRMKEAIVRPAEIEKREALIDGQKLAVQTITLHPFENDPQKARMQGFDKLSLTVTMSPDVPGWYQSLKAQVADPDGKEEIFVSSLTFESFGVGK